MERRKFTREFKLEAVRLIRDRGVSYVQASQDLNVHTSQLRDWVKKFCDDPEHAFPGNGQMKPEQLEIARLKREVAKLKAGRNILKKPRPTSRRNRREVLLHCEAPGDLGRGLDVPGARCLARWVLWVADTTSQSPQPGRPRACCQGASELPGERSNLRCQARVAGLAGGWTIVRSAPHRAIDAIAGPQSTSAVGGACRPTGVRGRRAPSLGTCWTAALKPPPPTANDR
jgi:transposase